ncbi:MAG: formate dehydrogenase accessory protein FdhE [Candidatus Sericytochromatia bacterium]|nr:formate dehydrogenase accessory protein FdhE [Candidatus Sericytochromatia bacterium]
MGAKTLTLDDYRRLFPATSRALALHDALRPLLAVSPTLSGPLPSLDTVAIEQAWQSGRPIVDQLSPGSSAEPLRQILRQVTATMQQHLTTLGPLDVLGDSQRLGDADLIELANGVSNSEPAALEKIGRLTGANPTGAAFAMAFSMSVFYHAICRLLPTDLDLSMWQRQTCPVCAGTPSIARLNAQGERVAYCHRCSAQWHLPAELCGACGSTDPDSRLKLALPGHPARWAEVCRNCRQSLKVIDESQIGAVCDLYFEDVVTLALDEMARDAAATLETPKPAEEPALSAR